jgi:hypothetical protein
MFLVWEVFTIGAGKNVDDFAAWMYHSQSGFQFSLSYSAEKKLVQGNDHCPAIQDLSH